MGLYYMTVKNIVKSTQSAVASASYRSGESLYSERDMEMKSYGEREVQPETFILAPKHAPEWAVDREKLWNEVEKVERNWNSRLAKEVLVALPVELTKEQQTKMLKEYVQENFIDNGMVADVSIHRDKLHNPHAHIMLTVRPFNEDGTWGNKKKRIPVIENGQEVLDEKGKVKTVSVPTTNWYDKETLLIWRKNYAEKINEHYRNLGISETVSHESYEKQGIDKLPKQRLSREEYAIEKREREQAEKEGREYKPKTYYGQLNAEIEKVNNELQNINNKIISLSDYRQKQQHAITDQLNNIRRNAKLSSEDWNSLKVVGGRLNGFVDYTKAKDNLNKLDNWKKKLDYQKRMLDAEKNVLSKASIIYKTEPKKVMLYGFIPNKFVEQFNDLVSSYKENLDKFETTFSQYQDLRKHSERVYEIQNEFIREEFAFLYPNYANDFKEQNQFVDDIKAKYVELFKKEGTIRKELPELEKENGYLTSRLQNLNKVLVDWKEINNSLVILERTKEKRKFEYQDAYRNDFESSKVYKASVKYAEARDQLSSKEIEKSKIGEKLLEQMKLHYPDYTDEMISAIPSELQSKVLELNLNEQATGVLSDDLEVVKSTSKYSNKDKYNDEKQHEQNNSLDIPNSKDAGMLLSSLINQAKQQEQGKDDELERKRKMRKRKLYRQIGEQEL